MARSPSEVSGLAPEIPIREVRLHRMQGQVFRARKTHPYRVMAAGRRFGKTTLGCTELIAAAAERPLKYWYVAPLMKDAIDIAWRPLKGLVPETWLLKAPNESRHEIEIDGGAILALKGADDPDTLRGRGLGGVVIDEYADIKPALWDEVIQPALLDTGGWALFLGTPKGFDHFYDLYQQGQNSAFPEWASWQFRTADAPHINKERLASIRRQYEQRGQLRLYLQEFEASFESNAGYILGALWKATHTVTAADGHLLKVGCREGQIIPWHVHDDPHWFPPKDALIYGSVDYGYGAPWAAYLHAVLPNGHVRTFHEWYAQEVRDVDQADRMATTIEAFMARGMARPEYVVLEPVMYGSRREMGIAKTIAEVYDDRFRPIGVTLLQGAGGRSVRVSRPQRWMDALSVGPHGVPHWSCTAACPNLIRTVPRVPWDEDDPEVADGDSDDHAFESLGRFFEARPVGRSTSPQEVARQQLRAQIATLDPLSRQEQERMRQQELGPQRPPTIFPRGF